MLILPGAGALAVEQNSCHQAVVFQAFRGMRLAEIQRRNTLGAESMKDKQDKPQTDKEKVNPPTPSQAEGDERTVDQALKNKQAKDQK
jgi:hypothetical protein